MMPFRAALLASSALKPVGGGSTPGGGVDGTPPSSTRWRINFTSRQVATNWFTLTEIEMLDTAGGTDQCTSGTPSSSYSYNSAALLFDDNRGTQWQSGTNALGWVQYEFTAPKTIQAVSIAIGSTPGDAPTAFDVQYWNTTTNAWVTYWSEQSQWNTWPTGSEKRVYAKPLNAGVGALKWRLNISATGSPTAWPTLREIEWRVAAGGSDQTVPDNTAPFGNAFSDGYQLSPSNSVNNNLGDYWQAPGVPPRKLGYRFTTKKAIAEIAITAAPTVTDTPTAFTVEWFDEVNLVWVAQKTVSGLTWAVNETKVIAAV